MKTLWLLAFVALVVTGARADPKGVRAYVGQLVISPDPAPSTTDELASYLKANATKDHRYELIKGAPWEIHLVGVLPTTAGTAPVTLEFALASDRKLTALQAIEVPVKGGLVIAETKATTAAGFVANQAYVVRLVRVTGRKLHVLARAELTLRD